MSASERVYDSFIELLREHECSESRDAEGGEHMTMAARGLPVGGGLVLGLVMTVGGLLVMIASFYLIIKLAGLVDTISQKVKETKL